MFWTILMMSFRTVDSFLNPNISVLFSLEFSGLHYCLFVKVHSYFSVTFLFSATWLGYHVSHALSSIVLHKIESFFSFYFLIKWNLSEFSFLRNILIENLFRKFSIRTTVKSCFYPIFITLNSLFISATCFILSLHFSSVNKNPYDRCDWFYTDYSFVLYCRKADGFTNVPENDSYSSITFFSNSCIGRL